MVKKHFVSRDSLLRRALQLTSSQDSRRTLPKWASSQENESRSNGKTALRQVIDYKPEGPSTLKKSVLQTHFHRWAKPGRRFKRLSDKKRESSPLNFNLYANILAAPIRMDKQTFALLPSDLLIQFGLAKNANDPNEIMMMPLLSKDKRSLKLAKSYVRCSYQSLDWFLQSGRWRLALGMLLGSGKVIGSSPLNSVEVKNGLATNYLKVLMIDILAFWRNCVEEQKLLLDTEAEPICTLDWRHSTQSLSAFEYLEGGKRLQINLRNILGDIGIDNLVKVSGEEHNQEMILRLSNWNPQEVSRSPTKGFLILLYKYMIYNNSRNV